MKRIIVCLLCLLGICGIHGLYANENAMTHYVTGNVRLRAGDTVSSVLITTLPAYTALRIVETGKSETIDGMTAPWIKIESQTGYTGWCFSGYVRRIESNVAEDIAVSFAKRKDGAYPDRPWIPERGNVSSIDVIQPVTGYYIQQLGRRYQGDGRKPEILALSVDNGTVSIREIDVINGETITRHEIRLRFNGRTYVHNRTKLETQNGKIQIIYLENAPEEMLYSLWEYEDPYTFAGDLNLPLPDKVRRLTSDYLRRFTGRYVFDSCAILRSETRPIDIPKMKNTVLQIAYDPEQKCLTIPVDTLRNLYGRPADTESQHLFGFVETIAEEPFWWIYGEGVGFDEKRLYFYKGGIAFTHEETWPDFNDNHESIGVKSTKYVVFFRKND